MDFLLFQTFPLFLDPLFMAILSGQLTPVPWYSHMRIQTFILTHFSPLVLNGGIVYLQMLSAISTLPAFKCAIVNLL